MFWATNSRQQTSRKVVTLNVYDLPGAEQSNDVIFFSFFSDYCLTYCLLIVIFYSFLQWLYRMGLGFYHTGVEIGDDDSASRSNPIEFSFSAQGIQRTSPRLPDFGRLREQILIGTFEGNLQDITNIVNRMSDGLFAPGNYDLIRLNCNAFSEAFCTELVNKSIPSWVNRAASIGSTFQGSNANATSATSEPQSSHSTTQSGLPPIGELSTNQSHEKLNASRNVSSETKKKSVQPSTFLSSIFRMTSAGVDNTSSTATTTGTTNTSSSIMDNTKRNDKKKELTEKQKALLSNLKNKKG